MHQSKRIILKSLFVALTAFFCFNSFQPAALASAISTDFPKVKNVIILIPDGMSVDGTTLTRWYNGGSPLALDEMACGLVRTYSADAPIADSAPASTAYATGHKSHTGYIGVLPDTADMPGQTPIKTEDAKKPVASILEAARLAGKSTGLVATCEIPHATPADFSAHYPDRLNYDDIIEQQVYQGIDVVFAGGEKFLQAANRKDNEDLVSILKEKGYQFITSRVEMLSLEKGPVWGMFADTAMAYDFDRPADEPSVAEMTEKALDLLSENDKGFFLMVEGSKVDWASHANDPIGVISEVRAFDQAVQVAVDFAKKDGNTLVIAVPDHGNGGLTIGDRSLSFNYDEQPLSVFISPLKKAVRSGEGIQKLGNGNVQSTIETAQTMYGLSDMTETEKDAVKKVVENKGYLNAIIGPMLSSRAHIGWTTGGHTGEDVVLYVYAPKGPCLTGVIENTDIALYMEKVMQLDLDATTNRLFIPISALEKNGATVSIDKNDQNNVVLVVKKDGKAIELPANKNIAIVDGDEQELEGLNVYNGVSFFVPKQVLGLLN